MHEFDWKAARTDSTILEGRLNAPNLIGQRLGYEL